MRLDDDTLHGRAANVVSAGPPAIHFLGEDAVGAVGGCFDADAFEDWREHFAGGEGFGFGGGHFGWHELFLLYFGFEGLEGLGPEAVEVGPEVGKTSGVELVVTAGAGGAGLHEMGLFEDAEVLGDGWAGDGEFAGEFADSEWAMAEAFEDGAAGEVTYGVELVLVSLH
jgi:hypothetical protein